MKSETRYIFSKGDLLQKDFSIKFSTDDSNIYLPIKDTKEIYCFNEITLSTKLLNMFAKAGIIIHFFDYYGNYIGTFYPKDYLFSGKLIISQSQAYFNRRMDIAKAIVKGIAYNIHFVLYHYYRHGKEELKPFLDWVKNDTCTLIEKCSDIKRLLSIEGKIWAQFYSTFKYILPEDFRMCKRVKRPPDNPINALISFSNSLLYTKTINQLYHTHLNQTISYLHEPSESRFSLSLDLSEVFKPIITFRTIFDCVNNRKLTVEKHFDKKFNYALLNEDGRKIFINEFENRLNQTFQHPILKRKVTYKQTIRLDAYKLIKFILEDKEFIPFNLEKKI